MKKLGILTALFLTFGIFSCQQMSQEHEEPTNGEQEGGYRRYYEDTRRAALGENWEQITVENFERASQARLIQREDAFAGGALEGNWYERGSSTVAGSIVATYFYTATEELYAISESGVLMKGGLTGGAWSILTDAIKFKNNILAVVPNGGGKRIITAKSDHKIYYSDDEGATWTTASGGISNPYSWGAGGKKLIVLNNGIMYYLQHVWQGSPWGSGYKLHRSADNGASWTNIQSFGVRDENKVTMWSPFGSNELYLFDQATTLYKLQNTESSLTVLNSSMTWGVGNYSVTGFNYRLTGYQNGANLTLYALRNSNVLFKSTNNGTTWDSLTTLSPSTWDVGVVANPWVADALYYGAVEFYKSTAATPSFSRPNTWSQYYNNIDLIHADIVSITPFQKSDGTKFILIGNHGGIHYLPEPYTTTTNLTKTGIRNADYYDVVTVAGTIFAGAQDQGNQRFAGGTGTSVLTASQLISGDYVRLNATVNGTKYWQEYPNTGTSSTFHYYNSPLTQQGTTAQASVYGENGVYMQYWSTPTCNWSVASENSILVGGGGTSSGATTSQIVKLTYDGSTIVKTAYAYDFKANGSGYITALDHSPANANYMYVGLNNGKFFYSHNAGTTWTQTASFTGPTNGWTYGSFIHASRINPLLAFYCGSGGKVYKTINGGFSFSDMSTGLPNSFINELTLNSAETLLFAATDAGPYVCVLSTGQWYSMATTTTPIMSFTAVEWLASDNIVRFATYGRGVWDFQITQQVLPVSYKSFEVNATDNMQVNIKWSTEVEADLTHFEVEKSYDGITFSTLETVKARNKASQYTLLDKMPVIGVPNYYRIKSVSAAGKPEYTSIKSVLLNNTKQVNAVYPTLVHTEGVIHVQSSADNQQFYLLDNQGRILMQQKLSQSTQQLPLPQLPNGVYIYSIRSADNRQVVKTGKLMVL